MPATLKLNISKNHWRHCKRGLQSRKKQIFIRKNISFKFSASGIIRLKSPKTFIYAKKTGINRDQNLKTSTSIFQIEFISSKVKLFKSFAKIFLQFAKFYRREHNFLFPDKSLYHHQNIVPSFVLYLLFLFK